MKKSFVFLLFLSLLLTSCAGTKYTSAKSQTSSGKDIVGRDTERKVDRNLEVPNQEEVEFPLGNKFNDSSFLLNDRIIATATDHLGVRYKYGGTTKSGFDCSGLVYTSFKRFDISLPRSSFEMAEFGQKIKDSEAQKGDLIFFITNGGRRINHVGIITEVNRDEIKFVHASTKSGVIISSTKEPYYKKNFVKIARVL